MLEKNKKKAKEKEKLNKNRLIIVFSLVLLLWAFYCIGYVWASWTSPDTVVTIDNINSSAWTGGTASSSNQIFYSTSKNRWYMLYAKYTGGGKDHYGYYAYSNEGDLTYWNNGGVCTGKIRASSYSGASCGYSLAWDYDNVNEIGHLVYLRDYTSGTPYGLYYRNFTIASNGALDFGTVRTLYAQSSLTFQGGIDLCLSHNGKPMISFIGNWFNNARIYAIMCNSINGYSDSWTWILHTSGVAYISCSSIMPTGNSSCVLFRQSGTNPIKVYPIDFTSTTNESITVTIFSDLNVETEVLTNNNYVWYYGISYNLTHGLVHYSDASSKDAFAYLFDFETMTRTSEEKTCNFGDGSAYRCAWTGGTFHDNEAFTTNYNKVELAIPHDIWGNEYHNPAYDGFFNVSSGGPIANDYHSLAESSYNGAPMTTSRFCSPEGTNVIGCTTPSYTVSVTWWTVEGEYGEPPPPIPQIIPWNMAMLFMFMVGSGMLILGPMLFFFMVKGDMASLPEALAFCFILMAVGASLVIGWLLA